MRHFCYPWVQTLLPDGALRKAVKRTMEPAQIEAFLARTTLRQIEVLFAVEKQSSMTGAAKSLGMTVSNVSRTTKRFEENTGLQIFSKKLKRGALTPESLKIINCFRSLMTDITQLRVDLETLVSAQIEGARAPVPKATTKPAVAVGDSVQHDYIVCLEDGKKLKMLKRHLRAKFDMSPEEYRARWSLPRDYPMVAPVYAERRRVLAKEIAFGRGPGAVAARQRRAEEAG